MAEWRTKRRRITTMALCSITSSGRPEDFSCIEWGMEQRICCSGCVQFADHVGLTIDDRDHDAPMAEALATRATKHKHRDKQCLQLWLKPSDTLRTKEHKRLASLQRIFIV